MSAIAPPAAPAAAAAGAADSAFDSSFFGRGRRDGRRGRWLPWRRRGLVLAVLLCCLGVFAIARWLAAAPTMAVSWTDDPEGRLVIDASPSPLVQAQRGHAVLAFAVAGQPELAVDALLLHRAARWQVDDGARMRQLRQQRALARLLAAADGSVEARLDSGELLRIDVAPRGWAGLGIWFWPLAALALLLCLVASVLLLARGRPRSLLFVVMCLCQAANLLSIAIEAAPGIVAEAGTFAGDMRLRAALDLGTAAALVHAFALHPRRLPQLRWIAALAWTPLALWLLLVPAGTAAPGAGLWWWAQGTTLALAAGALAVLRQSRRAEPDPYALVMQRLGAASLAALALASIAVALAARVPDMAAGVAFGASVAWTVFFAGLLLLTPFLARGRQLLREFALLAGISAVATALDLVFVAVFSLEPFTSLALAVFIAVALYAAAREWMKGYLLGGNMLTTERIFDQIYRAARELQSVPARYPQLLTQLLRELFEPLELHHVAKAPARTRVGGGGSALLVPMRGIDDEAAPAGALALRFAQRGQRLFTVDDARLADRVVDQLRRAVAYDQAVERGRHEERQRIAQDLHDDIGARLLTLMYQAPTPEMEDYVRRTLQDLKTLTRGLAASEHRLSHAAAEWKADLVQRIAAADATLGWAFQCDRDLDLTMVQWSALTRVLRELVSNALFHGHAGRIEVRFGLEAGQLVLQVADDGAGRQPQAWSHGLGLGGVRKRVKLLGGEVGWRENVPRGIVCTVRVPDFSGRP